MISFDVRRPFVLALIPLSTLAVRRGHAQTDFYNTDRGRPIQIEDAYAAERYAFELKLAPVRLERAIGGTYRWGVEPELEYGILPRTHIELGVPLAYADLGRQHRSGIAGLDVSIFHNLNVETTTWPALALRADVLAPVGNLAADRAYGTFTAIATRTYGWARFHVNGQYTAGAAPSAREAAATFGTLAGPGAVEISRWLAGVAIDKTYPLQSLLVTAEFYGREPIVAADVEKRVEYTTGAGVRYQLGPKLALDGGAGRRLNGDEQGWYVTFGTAYAFGLASLMPGR